MDLQHVVISDTCADQCGRALGWLDREAVRDWLHDRITRNGHITDHLPPPFQDKTSPSGLFILIDDAAALPLATNNPAGRHLIATGCHVFPDYRHAWLDDRDLNPFTLTTLDLLNHTHFTAHTILRFQQRFPSSRDPKKAHKELFALLAAGATAYHRPPAWTRLKPDAADFYIVWDNEICLPATRDGIDGSTFTAKTFIHRATDLFNLDAAQLLALTKYEPSNPTWTPDKIATLKECTSRAATTPGYRPLNWIAPRWAPTYPDARLWLWFGTQHTAPLTYSDSDRRRPLLMLDLCYGRGLWGYLDPF